MKQIFFGLMLMILSGQALAHGVHNSTNPKLNCSFTASEYDGYWSVFYPTGGKTVPSLEAGSFLAIGYIAETDDVRVFVHDSLWQVANSPVKAIDVDGCLKLILNMKHQDGTTALMCVERITRLTDLATRAPDIMKLSQLGLYNSRQASWCSEDIASKNRSDKENSQNILNPGHSHADK